MYATVELAEVQNESSMDYDCYTLHCAKLYKPLCFQIFGIEDGTYIPVVFTSLSLKR